MQLNDTAQTRIFYWRVFKLRAARTHYWWMTDLDEWTSNTTSQFHWQLSTLRIHYGVSIAHCIKVAHINCNGLSDIRSSLFSLTHLILVDDSVRQYVSNKTYHAHTSVCLLTFMSSDLHLMYRSSQLHKMQLCKFCSILTSTTRHVYLQSTCINW